MTRLHPIVLILAVGLMAAGCRSSKENTREDMKETTSTQMPMPAKPGPGIAPGHCRIVGTVTAIDPQRSERTDDPCSKAPCTATVKVNEVVGYGSGFSDVLGKGAQIKVRFRYTLAPTADLFPNMAPSLPGLAVGSVFQADLQKLAPSLAGTGESGYVVGQYEQK